MPGRLNMRGAHPGGAAHFRTYFSAAAPLPGRTGHPHTPHLQDVHRIQTLVRKAGCRRRPEAPGLSGWQRGGARRTGEAGPRGQDIICLHFSICACRPCAGARLLFFASFRYKWVIPEGNPSPPAFACKCKHINDMNM